jgi:hypothetical protein
VRVRALAVAAAAAVMLVSGTASAGRIEASIVDVRATASTGAATVTWTTSVPMRGRVSYGIGGIYLYTARELTATTQHTVALPDLTSASTYDFRIDSTAGRATATETGRVTTAAPPLEPRFDVSGTHVTVDGSLFFPVLSYEQCAATIARALAIGVNTFVQVPFTGCGTPAGITPPYVLSDNYAGTDGAGWYLPDEPDGWGITPEQMPKLAPVASTGHLRVLNISQHFFSEQAPINDRFDRNDYKRFAAEADVVGFDMYPIVKFCGRVPLLDVFRAQRELMTTYALGKPTFQWIETSKMTGECASMQITPATVNAETWLAITGGACGIGYFTNSWTSKLWDRWSFDPGIEEQLAATISRVQKLAPALCADYGDVVVPWNGSVAASSRTLNGALYVLAVNSSAAPTTVPFRVDALAGRTLTVLDEGRTITPAKKVFFRDRFAPYEVHVYVAAPTG